MKKFKDFQVEEDETESPSRENLVNIIANSLNRVSGKEDQKNVLMLIAALGLLNATKEQGLALSVARKLATTRK